MSAMHICHDKGLFEGKYPRTGNIQMSLKEIQFQESHVVDCCNIKLHRKNTISDGSSGKKLFSMAMSLKKHALRNNLRQTK